MYLDGRMADVCHTNWEGNEPKRGEENKITSYLD